MSEWISSEFRSASTNRTMIDYLAIRVLSTNTSTRVRTFLICTCLIIFAFRTHYTFWSTCGRSSNECRQTWTYCLIIDGFTLTIWPTRWRVTWVVRFYWSVCIYKFYLFTLLFILLFYTKNIPWGKITEQYLKGSPV